VNANLQKFLAGLGAVALSAGMAGCASEMTRDSHSPVRLVVNSLEVNDEQSTLLSDVIRLVRQPAPCSPTSPCPSVFNDSAVVNLSIILRDPGTPGSPSSPSTLNQVTINRYRVTYRRADGHNTPGVDVPYDFDSALTVTVPPSGDVEVAFQIVRHSAKEEAPLAALRYTDDIISTIGEVTFYGRDQAGNDVSASARIGIDFGDFADSNN
jgi:hypothetical protein